MNNQELEVVNVLDDLMIYQHPEYDPSDPSYGCFNDKWYDFVAREEDAEIVLLYHDEKTNL